MTRRNCVCGKRVFYTRASAVLVAAKLARAGRPVAMVYECHRRPGRWHVTTHPRS